MTVKRKSYLFSCRSVLCRLVEGDTEEAEEELRHQRLIKKMFEENAGLLKAQL